MPFFGFRRAKKKLSANALCHKLRKTKSTNDINDPQQTHSLSSRSSEESTTDNASMQSHGSSDNPDMHSAPNSNGNPRTSIEITQYDEPNVSSPKASTSNKPRPTSSSPRIQHDLTKRLSDINVDNLELLLSLETNVRQEAQAERERAEEEEESKYLAPRPTRLKFELPATPPRSRSPNARVYPRARPRPNRPLSEDSIARLPQRSTKKSRWRSLILESDTDEEEPLQLQIGSKVRLIKRPLPTLGYIRYLGPLENEEGIWVGVELESGVGSNDGCFNGKRYFQTGPNYGAFARDYEVTIV